MTFFIDCADSAEIRHVGTLPPNILRPTFQHPLTDKGLAAFLTDWAKTGQSILGETRAAAE
jgi:transaldolase